VGVWKKGGRQKEDTENMAGMQQIDVWQAWFCEVTEKTDGEKGREGERERERERESC